MQQEYNTLKQALMATKKLLSLPGYKVPLEGDVDVSDLTYLGTCHEEQINGLKYNKLLLDRHLSKLTKLMPKETTRADLSEQEGGNSGMTKDMVDVLLRDAVELIEDDERSGSWTYNATKKARKRILAVIEHSVQNSDVGRLWKAFYREQIGDIKSIMCNQLDPSRTFIAATDTLRFIINNLDDRSDPFE